MRKPLILILVLLLGQKCPAQPNPPAAPMLIESATVNGQAVALSGSSASVEVRARQDQLEIHYAAVGPTAPKEGPFRFRLDGFDAAWHDAGSNRLARFNNLLPGRYVFKVQSAKQNGAWDEMGATLLVTVSAGFDFELLCALAVLVAGLLLGGIVYFQMRRKGRAI